MNVNNINITGINDLSEDVELLKSELSILSDDYNDYKISNGTNISI